jgi:lysozyme family protein
MGVNLDDKLKAEYRELFARCVPSPGKEQFVERIVTTAIANRTRYEIVAKATGVPWFVIAALHNMECSQRFDQHLHNGDPLKARTVNVPANRPAKFPCTWEESAIDAFEFDRFDRWSDWSIAGTLYKMEAFNGFGSRNHGVHTPYLWGGSFEDTNGNGKLDAGEKPIYVGGKYIRDHVWDSKAISQQIGAAVVLRYMATRGLVPWRVTSTVDAKPETTVAR